MILLDSLAAWLFKLDASRKWGRDGQPATIEDIEDCRDARECPPPKGPTFPIVDIEEDSTKVKYRNSGRVKRTRFPRVKLATRRVIVVLHQMGVERSPLSKRWPLVTCHRVIGPDATRMRVHPLDVRLIAANRADRAPWHAISIEFAGNFEGHDGEGDWWLPNSMGRGRASDNQIIAGRQEVAAIIEEVAALGGCVEGIAPHRVFGRDSKGRPNRPICPGSRVWSEVGEHCAREHSLAVPAPGWSLGGLSIPSVWRGPYFSDRSRFLVQELSN